MRGGASGCWEMSFRGGSGGQQTPLISPGVGVVELEPIHPVCGRRVNRGSRKIGGKIKWFGTSRTSPIAEQENE